MGPTFLPNNPKSFLPIPTLLNFLKEKKYRRKYLGSKNG